MDIMQMNLDEVFDEMQRLHVKYRVSTLEYSRSVWVEISGKYDGVEIKSEETVTLKEERLGAVVRRVFAKWYSTANHGCGGVLSPPVEAKAIEGPTDLPF